MELLIFTEPQQGASYDTLLSVARTAEECGFHGFFRSDHYLKMGAVSGLPGPTDAWITLAALARDTSRLRLGTMLTAGTFRLPGPLAIAVAQVDQMSGGRAELGLGAGWFEAEHLAYGIPFGTERERHERLVEQLQIIKGLWETPVGEKYSFAGRHYALESAPGLPKPAQQPRPPVIVGGSGLRRTPAMAAAHADELNVPFMDVAGAAKRIDAARAACHEIGREPSSLRYSAALTTCCGRDEAEVARCAASIGEDLADLRASGLAGTPAQLVERIGDYAAVGVDRIYLQILDLDDLAHIELLGSDVLRQVA
ncbi:MAG TPA: LLM class F420-dependent oxidoreductase [Actinomycetes bacterium]|nr:LLM class F420-dependent oxidoreductase [Actinomycetes bacterium]